MVSQQGAEALALLQLSQNEAGNFVQRLEYAGALESHGFENRFLFANQLALQIVEAHRRGQIALVRELQHVRDLREIVTVLLQIFLEIIEGFHVGVHTLFLGISDEDHAIDTTQDELAAGIVEDLSWNGIEMETSAEATNRAQIEWQEVKKQGSVSLGGQRDHLALLFLASLVVNVLKIGGLAPEAGAVIDNFAINFAGGEVYETQGPASF